jgi:hypothetical protein
MLNAMTLFRHAKNEFWRLLLSIGLAIWELVLSFSLPLSFWTVVGLVLGIGLILFIPLVFFVTFWIAKEKIMYGEFKDVLILMRDYLAKEAATPTKADKGKKPK